MNVFRGFKVPNSFTKPYLVRSLSEGNVDKKKNLFLRPGEHQIKYLKEIDKGNASQLSKMKLVFKHSSGYYSLMPFLYRSYAKLIKAIENHMNDVGGQRVLMPSLYQIELLKQSDRFDILQNELFQLKDRNDKELYLAPTHEEPITSIVSSNFNERQLPLLLYQIDSKFRYEIRPRFGLLRANQFIMKDMYSFDKDQDSAIKTYEKVCRAYVDLFEYIGLNTINVNASNGLMGGNFSHEFHLVSKYGEDKIYLCDNCKTAYNREVLLERKMNDEQQNEDKCPKCESSMQHEKSIEIGHTFYLGTKYSEKMNACSTDSGPLEMCCFGIGVTRILSALIAQSDSISIDWPLRMAPYNVLIIPPKQGSKENVDEIGTKMADSIANVLKQKGLDVLIDNRSELTIGRRMIDSLAFGFPFKIIIGKESNNEVPKFELHSTSSESKDILTHAELLAKFDQISKLL